LIAIKSLLSLFNDNIICIQNNIIIITNSNALVTIHFS